MSDIKPRYDNDGVPWCVLEECPAYHIPLPVEVEHMACATSVDGWDRGVDIICPVAVIRMAKDKARMFDLISRTGVAIKKYFDHPLWSWVPHLDALLDEIEDISAAIDAAGEDGDD